MRFATAPVVAVALLAVAFHVYEASSEWRMSFFSVGVFAWSLAPYLAAVLIAIGSRRSLLGTVPASLALILDLYTLVAVRYFSHSSTAALSFLVVPLLNLVLVVPVGVAGALVFLKWQHARRERNVSLK